MERARREMQNALSEWIDNKVKIELDQYKQQLIDSFNNTEEDFNPSNDINQEQLAENALSLEDSNQKDLKINRGLSKIVELNSIEEQKLYESASDEFTKYFAWMEDYVKGIMKSTISEQFEGVNKINSEFEYIKDRVDNMSLLISNHTHGMESIEK